MTTDRSLLALDFYKTDARALVEDRYPVPSVAHKILGAVKDRGGNQFRVTVFFQKADAVRPGETNLSFLIVVIIALIATQDYDTRERSTLRTLKEKISNVCREVAKSTKPICQLLGFRVWFFSNLPAGEDLDSLMVDIYDDIELALPDVDMQMQVFTCDEEFDILRKSLEREVRFGFRRNFMS